MTHWRSKIRVICDPTKITYAVAGNGKSITFQPCGNTSYHPKDIEQRYCSWCHRFMELVELANQLKEESE
jgi:hypothetical protein